MTDSARAGVAGAGGAVAAHSEGARGKGSVITPHVEYRQARNVPPTLLATHTKVCGTQPCRQLHRLRAACDSMGHQRGGATMSIHRRRAVTALAALLTFAAPLAARAEPVQNV